MRQRHTTPLDDIRQPGWDQWIANACGLTDYSQSLLATALARCPLLASALGLAVSAVARRAANIGRQTARQGIAASLPSETRSLEVRLARAFRNRLPRKLLRQATPIAIDIHRRPYYGDRQHTPGVTGGKAQRGTKWFWSYATATSLVPGHRHTLAITTIAASDTLTDVVERLLIQVVHSGVSIRYVLLDRAFYAVGVVNALKRRGLRFIIPMVRRGQEVQKFFRRGTRGWFDHTFRSRRRHEGSATVRVAVVGSFDGRRRPLVFATSEGFHSLAGVVLVYRRRFGIESSYRQLGECLAATTSRDGVYRLLLVGVSLLIRSWWVELGGVKLAEVLWDLILAFTTPESLSFTHATQPLAPQPHSTT